MAELAVGHISIVPTTDQIAPGVRKALKGAGKIGDDAGRSIGSRISSGIGTAVKGAVAGIGIAAGGTLAASITKGLGRLSGIENAEAKLSGLGHEAEGVASIMDDALKSVEGTSYGLEEAATVAASAVAAGIEPGEALQRTLKMTGDAASIAGIDISSMGSIVNKVATSDMMQMDVANQLMDAGIPILQMVAEEMGVTAEEARKMASAGEVNFEIFQTALEDGVGGAALKAGETVQGSFANMGAAMGRFGATLMDPLFTSAPAIFTAVGTAFDEINEAVTPAAEQIGQILAPALDNVAGLIETRVAPFVGDVAGKFGDLAVKATEVVVDPETWERIGDVFSEISGTVGELWPSIESLAGSFARVVGSISVATWQALGSTLEALTPLVESVLVPLVEQVADFAEQNPGAVQAMVVAFLGFKGVGAIAGPVKSFTGALTNLGGAFNTARTYIGAGGVVEGIKELGKHSKDSNPALAKMGGGVSRFGGILSKAGKFFQPLLRGLSFVIRFVNPWVAGITAIVGALTWFFTQTETGKAIWDGFTSALSSGWDWVVETLSIGWQWIQDNVFTPLMNFVTGTLAPIWNSVMGGLKTAWDGVVSGIQWAWDTIFQPVFNGIWQVAQVTIGVIGTLILAPLLVAWNVLSSGIQAGWNNIIRPAWDALSAAASWLWDSLQSVFTWIGDKWNQMGTILQVGWQWIKTNVIDAFILAVQNFWNSYISPIFTWIGDKWNQMGNLMQTVWGWIRTNVIDAFANALTNFWNSYVSPILDWIGNKWQWLQDTLGRIWNWIKTNVIDAFANALSNFWNNTVTPILDWIGDKWDWLGDKFGQVWNWIDENVFTPFKNGFQAIWDFVSDVVDGIRDVWNELRGHLAKPINFMIGTVYNDGILSAWNTIADILPGLNQGDPLPLIPEHATGGRITGPGTGTSDDVLMYGSNGEHMLTEAEVNRAGGHAHIYAMRQFLRFGRPFSVDGRGGITPLPRDPDNRVGDLAGAAPGLVPKFATGGEIRPAWEAQLQAAHEFARAQHGKPYQWAGPTGPGSSFDCSGYMGSIAAAIQGTNPWQRYWATMAFPPGAQGFVPGLAQGFSVGIWNGGPYGGHTAGTLSAAGPFGTTNVEAGGSPSLVKYGTGAVGADHSQFRQHWHLPIGADGAFESGGGGGFFDMLGAIKDWIFGKFDDLLDPIRSLLPSKPPEWMGIPGGVLESGWDGLKDFATDKVEALGDLTSAVWGRITDFDLFDNGGVWKSGTAGVNLSGADEYVFTNRSMRNFAASTRSLHQAADSLGADVHRWVNNGITELERIANSAEVIEARQEFEQTARESGESYLAGQATSVLDIVGMGQLVDVGLDLGSQAWEAYQASPFDVGFNGQGVVVEIEAESDDDLVRVRQLREMADRVHGLEVKVNRKQPAAAVTRGGAM